MDIFSPSINTDDSWVPVKNSPLFRAESGKLSKVVVWSPLSTENQRIWRLGHPTHRPTRKNGLFGLDCLSAFCTKNGAGWSGDISGDKLSGLTDHLGGLSDSEPGPRRAVGPRKTLQRRSSGTVLRTFAPKKQVVTKR